MSAEVPQLNIEALRKSRDILPMATDYYSDDLRATLGERVGYYKTLREKLGLQQIRTEFRMGRMIPESEKGKPVPDIQFDKQIDSAYLDSLKSMKEAGMGHPTIVLFTPSKWMVEQATGNPTEFFQMYRKYVKHVLDLCSEAGVAPKYLQVMNEVNFAMQTPFDFDTSVSLIQETYDILSKDQRFPETKTMTTVYAGTTREQLSELETSMKHSAAKLGSWAGERATALIDFAKPRLGKAIDTSMVGKMLGPYMRWQEFVVDLVAKTGDSLQAIGFDSYPGSYDRPAISLHSSDLAHSRPFKSYGDVTPLKWAADQKLDGVLRDKDVLITETGVFAVSDNSRQQKMGYMRIVQALDHLLLDYEKRGIKASDIFQGIMFFQVGEHAGVTVKAPMSLDFRPWTLLRKGKNGEWIFTEAVEDKHKKLTLKHLIDSRIFAKS